MIITNNKNKLLRIFQDKSKKGTKDQDILSSIQLQTTKGDFTNSEYEEKNNTEESNKRHSNFTQISDLNYNNLADIQNRESWETDKPNKRFEEDKYAEYNKETKIRDSNSTEDKTKEDNEEIFHDFDQQDNQEYDIEEIKECMEMNKINNIKVIEQNDQDFSLFSEEMYSDIKRLLYLFGIPYIDAPFEAESQWAYLELTGKVDGVITQDSDVFLFGSRNVYRDIFEQNKFVEYYNMKIIESDLGFDRNSLIWMALLLGSDYTIGVKGIGPVNATEVVQAFQTVKSLKRFKEWADKGTFQDLEEIKQEVEKYHQEERNDNAPKKLKDFEMKAEYEYKVKHKEMLKHWEFPSGFPNTDVEDGYLKPNIDDLDGIELSWSKPNFKALKELALNKLNWHPREIENCITEAEKKRKDGWSSIVFKNEGNDSKQKSITEYFNKQLKFAEYKSKRILTAIGKIKDQQNKKSSLK